MEILKAPHKILSGRSTPVDLSELGDVRDYAKEMIKLLRNTDEGIGLAAPQVGIQQRFFVDLSKGMARVLINPVLIYKSPELVTSIEGCLSIPDKKFKVYRHRQIMYSFTNLKGEEVVEAATGITSILIQHENDHLDGVLISEKGEEYVESE